MKDSKFSKSRHYNRFAKARAKYVRLLVEGVSELDVIARRVYARMLAETVLPVLEDDTNGEARMRSCSRVNMLMEELSSPKTRTRCGI